MGDQSVKQRAKKALNGVELAHVGTAKKRSSKSIPGGKGVHQEEVPENPKDKWYPKKLPESDVVYLARKKREQATNEKRIQKQKTERLKIENEKAQQLREERVKQAAEASQRRELKLARKNMQEEFAMMRANAKEALAKLTLLKQKKTGLRI